MANETPLPPVGARVLLAIDSDRPNEEVLRTVVALLGPQQLDLTALYVEDEDLLRAAALPGLREISSSGQQSNLEPARVAADIAREADAARRAFDALAQRLMAEHRQLQHRFRVARGYLVEELAQAAADSDFVMVTRTLRGNCLHGRLARSFAGLIRQPRHVLFVNEPWASGSSVVVLQGNPLALDYAARLAASEGLRLVVAVPDATGARPDLPAAATLRQVPRWDEESIAELCLAEDARLLVLPELSDLDWTELLVSLMDRLPCSVLKLAGATS